MYKYSEDKKAIVLDFHKSCGSIESITVRHDLSYETSFQDVFIAPEEGSKGTWFFVYKYFPKNPDWTILLGYFDGDCVYLSEKERINWWFGAGSSVSLKKELEERFGVKKIPIPRPSVADFAERMETTLSRHDAKKGGQKEWRKLRITEALAELEIEVAELRAAVVKCDDENTAHECIDVANRCMMLHDLVVKLREDYE
jgi:hypothetical protein